MLIAYSPPPLGDIRDVIVLSKWFNLTGGVHVDPKYGITIVNIKNLRYDTEPFVLASELSQVFYVKDMSRRPKKRKDKQANTSYDEPKRHIVSFREKKHRVSGGQDRHVRRL